MKILSIIHDGLLNAENVLLEMTVEDYLDIGLRVLDKNQYQRKRVSRSSTIYSLLGNDLKRLCTIPTIVLALTDENKRYALNQDMTSEEIKGVLDTESLIILDGLQRTYTIRDTMKELESDLLDDEESRRLFKKHLIRVEVYCGLSKTGILYRMLTLNTGQTPMSKRHEIEILYSSYLDKNIEGIRFNRQAAPDNAKDQGLDVYDFDNAIEGFNSFLDSDEMPMDRFDLLDVIQRLEKITEDDYQKDLFEQFIKLYNSFAHHIDEKTHHWILSESGKGKLGSIYAKDIASFFNKSQTISAFGAALGKILWDKTERGFGDIKDVIKNVRIDDRPDAMMMSLLNVLKEVRENAKKIGVAQRQYLKHFFLNLLKEGSDSFLEFGLSIDKAKKDYNEAIDIRPRQESLFD